MYLAVGYIIGMLCTAFGVGYLAADMDDPRDWTHTLLFIMVWPILWVVVLGIVLEVVIGE